MSFTVIVADALLVLLRAVTVAVPALIAVTSPDEVTVAIAVFDDSQVTVAPDTFLPLVKVTLEVN